MNPYFMQKALELALQGRYSTQPNPMVGAVLVQNNHIVGQGFHQKAGEAHAEILALQDAGAAAEGASLYINLEPCCHFGRTPPCSEALIAAKIKTVFIATLDPNPLVAGQGVQALKAAGIEVNVGLEESAARHLNRAFFHYITQKRPYLVGKWAMSLDGQMSVHPHDDRLLSGHESLVDLHDLRRQHPAILIGSVTAAMDNPSLTVRHGGHNARQPQRIVLNTCANLSPDLRLFNGELPGQTWLFCDETRYTEACQRFSPNTTRIFACPTQGALLDLHAVVRLLGAEEIMSVLVEGGRKLLNAFFQDALIDEVVTYLTPWIIAAGKHKQALLPLRAEVLGHDLKIQTLLK